MTLSNADKIRNMTDEELNLFLWTFKTNHLLLFMTHETHETRRTMTVPEQLEWLQREDDFIVPETLVPEGMTYDQNFKLKEESN